MTKIGIIGAMASEVASLKDLMEMNVIIKKAGMNFYDGILYGKSAVVVQCGYGKVNAGICAQILVDLFEVTHIINTGVAGSLNPKLGIGDILISEKALQHDMDSSPLGFAPGQIPDIDVLAFPADRAMIEAAVTACKKANPDIHVLTGLVVTGDQFISSRATKDRLVSVFHGDCAEMEGAAVAQVAYLNNLPFVIIRAISDKADDSAGVMDFPTFEKQAAEHCAKMTAEFLRNFEPALSLTHAG